MITNILCIKHVCWNVNMSIYKIENSGNNLKKICKVISEAPNENKKWTHFEDKNSSKTFPNRKKWGISVITVFVTLKVNMYKK